VTPLPLLLPPRVVNFEVVLADVVAAVVTDVVVAVVVADVVMQTSSLGFR